ncbi:hypothetical protein CVT25_003764 [Psilocybe cyanescens]|uniref:Uncharacterized protein n=1 Tax=Psilocybe cyanescens TaxID=93625 RepID=A0A409XU04_PSICY|nr:hypothetical protein CVT25_003764 [Psilocybe cyanescens]
MSSNALIVYQPTNSVTDTHTHQVNDTLVGVILGRWDLTLMPAKTLVSEIYAVSASFESSTASDSNPNPNPNPKVLGEGVGIGENGGVTLEGKGSVEVGVKVKAELKLKLKVAVKVKVKVEEAGDGREGTSQCKTSSLLVGAIINFWALHRLAMLSWLLPMLAISMHLFSSVVVVVRVKVGSTLVPESSQAVTGAAWGWAGRGRVEATDRGWEGEGENMEDRNSNHEEEEDEEMQMVLSMEKEVSPNTSFLPFLTHAPMKLFSTDSCVPLFIDLS